MNVNTAAPGIERLRSSPRFFVWIVKKSHYLGCEQRVCQGEVAAESRAVELHKGLRDACDCEANPQKPTEQRSR